jgi:WD40 repeat protein
VASSSIVAADGAFVSCAADGSAARVNLTSRWVLERVLGGEKPDSPFVDRVNALRFSPDGKTLATGGGEPSRTGDVVICDVAAGTVLKTWKERHSDAVLSIDFSPDGKQIASGGADKAVRITDIATGKQVRVFEGHTHHVLGVSFRADGRVLASAGADNVVKIWDMITGDRKKNIDGWDKEVTSAQFIGATDQILTSAGDNRVRLVRDSGAEIRAITGLPEFMYGAASTPTASVIVGGGQDSVLRVWDGTTGKEVVVFAAK